jgi:UDP-N-acetylglucosamine acyltransferase
MIHPTAIVETRNIGKNVSIGPYSCIAERVVIGDGCKIYGHASIGNPPQYKGKTYQDCGGRIVIEDGVEIREFVTINLPTIRDTVIGKGSLLMANVHIGHDCQIGKDCIFVVGAALGGLVTVGNFCYFGLNSSVHPEAEIADYCLVGAGSFFKGRSKIGLIWAGVPAKAVKINRIGIERNAVDKDAIIMMAMRNLEGMNE